VIDFLNGVAVCGSWGAAVFFLRYWRETHDRFFLLFAAAFVALSVNWLLLVFLQPAAEFRHLVYLWRLGGFLLILAAILDKNRRRSR
jgi:hypothetical protein